MITTTMILLALAGAVIAAVVGTFWYSDKTPMGRLHMRFLGYDKFSAEEKRKMREEAMPKMPKVYAAQMALSFLTAFATVFIVTLSVQNGVSFSLALGFVIFNWLCFIVPTIGTAVLWGNTGPKIAWPKFISDSLFNLVTLILIAILASFFV